MKTKFSVLAVIFTFLVSSISYSQKTETENVINDNTNNKITISETGLYDGTKSDKARNYYNKAKDFADNHDFNNAKKYYLKAIKEDDTYIEAYDNLGLTYRRLGKIDDAIIYYKKSIELYPSGITAHQNLATAYNIIKDYDNAIKEFNEIAKIEPNNPESYFGLANTYMTISKFDKALQNAKKALELYKKSNSHLVGDGYYLEGLIYYYKNDKIKAKEDFQNAKKLGVKLHPQIEQEFFSERDETKIELKTKEDYIKYEEKFIDDYKWLINTPLGKDQQKRKEKNAFILQWVSGCPYIHVDISEKIVTYPKCGECLMIFLGGWADYAIKTKEYDNKYKGNLIGTESVINFYKKNKSIIGKNKGVEKLIKLQDQKKLNDYIKSNTKNSH